MAEDIVKEWMRIQISDCRSTSISGKVFCWYDGEAERKVGPSKCVDFVLNSISVDVERTGSVRNSRTVWWNN